MTILINNFNIIFTYYTDFYETAARVAFQSKR